MGNAIKEITNKSKRIFVEAWQKERDRLLNLKKIFDKKKDQYLSDTGNVYFDYFAVKELMGLNIPHAGMYNRLNKADYDKMKELSRMLMDVNRGNFDSWLKNYRNTYYLNLVKKFQEASVKIKDFDLDGAVSINRGPKGFEISAPVVDSRGNKYRFYTFAYGAGGWNIQKFHFRYKSEVK